MPNSESSDDILRIEESWSHDNEVFIHDIRDDCVKLSEQHSVASKKNKKLYIGLNTPCIVIPIILASVNPFISLAYVNSVGMAVTGILTGVNANFNFSKKVEVHSSYSNKYNDLVGLIDKILIRKKKHREPYDVILERVTLIKSHLDDTAPDL